MSDFAGLRGHLQEGASPLLGVFVIVPRVEVVEIAAAAGFDLVVLDLEHGPFGVEALSPLIAAAHGAGMYAVVRVAGNDEQSIGAVLDCGADGLLVPHVGSGAEARRAVTASRFPPAGERSVHLWVRDAHYGADADHVTTADLSVAVLGMVEGQEAHARLDDITATEGLDSIFVGPMDLAASLGLGATPSDPRVTDAALNIVARAASAGRSTSIFAATPADAKKWLNVGVQLVVLSVDTALMTRGFAAAVSEARGVPDHSSHGKATR
ncbi:MAG: hpcH [Aeromicrobium sp.]|jgi:4-hydroxy-2-oxoheptanedioate aldolase|nr:hpcH [Aeromicrobium sp.]